MYSSEDIAAYFDDFAEQEWARFERSPVEEVKLWIHLTFLKEFIPRESHVLEIGAGPGRFTRELVRLGCSVTVADVSAVQLDLNRSRAEEEAYSSFVRGWHRVDVVDMAEFGSRSFDAVLCYGGPLSYALERRHQAARECARVLRSGGLFLTSVMSLWGTAHNALKAIMTVPPASNRHIVTTGDVTESALPGQRHSCHLFRAAELQRLLEEAGLHVIAMSASNSLTTRWDQELIGVRSDPMRWSELLELESLACVEAGCLDSGTHILAAARTAGDMSES